MASLGVDWERELKPIMKEAGFRKRNRNWYLESRETIAVFNLQWSSWGGGDFYINLGVLVKPLETLRWPPESKCHFRCRLSDLMPDWRRARALFHIEENFPIAQDIRRQEVLDAVKVLALPFLRRCGTVAGLRSLLTEYPKRRCDATERLLRFLDIPNANNR